MVRSTVRTRVVGVLHGAAVSVVACMCLVRYEALTPSIQHHLLPYGGKELGSWDYGTRVVSTPSLFFENNHLPIKDSKINEWYHLDSWLMQLLVKLSTLNPSSIKGTLFPCAPRPIR